MLAADTWLWVGFNLFVLAFLALDLGVFHRRPHTINVREAAAWSIGWVVLALVFNLGVLYFRGTEAALEFFTGYMIERSLSVDNIFAFALIFTYFAVPSVYQHRVLFWGVLGALVTRGLFIATGVVLLERLHWLIYVLGALLLITGARMAFARGHGASPERSPLVRLLRRWLPLAEGYQGQAFLVKQGGKLLATPLLLALLVVETMDIVFAIDSVPAIFAVTSDPFIIYTSNVFAILGLRALYFLLAGAIDRFSYLKYGLSAILVFVGFKMLISDIYEIPIAVSLVVIGALLATAIVASLQKRQVAPSARAEISTEHFAHTPSAGRQAGCRPTGLDAGGVNSN